MRPPTRAEATGCAIFSKSLPMMLLKGREATMQQFRPMLHAAGVTEQQWRVLRILEHDGSLEISELARRCLIMMPSISRTLQNMEARGWVTRQSMEGDKRKSEISISGSGRELVARVIPESDEIYRFIEQAFDSDKMNELKQLLEELHQSLSEAGVELPLLSWLTRSTGSNALRTTAQFTPVASTVISLARPSTAALVNGRLLRPNSLYRFS